MRRAGLLPSGKWRARADFEDYYGKKRTKSFTADTKKEAERLALECEFSHPKIKKNTDMTLRQAFERYVESRKDILVAGTLKEYNTIKRIHLQGIMDLKLGEITQELIQFEINEVARVKAPKTVKNIHAALYAVLKQYYPELRLNTSLPKSEPEDIVVPTEDEIKILYKAVKNTIMELPFLLASQNGLREAEIASLQDEHFLTDTLQVRIKRSASRGEEGFVFKGPKSRAGVRLLELSPITLDASINSKKHKSEILIKNKKFYDNVVGISPNAIGSRFSHIVEKCGIRKLKFHALRHYFCSQALLNNIPKEYIAKMMGHEDTTLIERVYGHTFEKEEVKFGLLMTRITDSIED